MLISELITLLIVAKAEKGDIPVYLEAKEQGINDLSRLNLTTSIVVQNYNAAECDRFSGIHEDFNLANSSTKPYASAFETNKGLIIGQIA